MTELPPDREGINHVSATRPPFPGLHVCDGLYLRGVFLLVGRSRATFGFNEALEIKGGRSDGDGGGVTAGGGEFRSERAEALAAKGEGGDLILLFEDESTCELMNFHGGF